jgi:hypothetical protein
MHRTAAPDPSSAAPSSNRSADPSSDGISLSDVNQRVFFNGIGQNTK